MILNDVNGHGATIDFEEYLDYLLPPSGDMYYFLDEIVRMISGGTQRAYSPTEEGRELLRKNRVKLKL